MMAPIPPSWHHPSLGTCPVKSLSPELLEEIFEFVSPITTFFIPGDDNIADASPDLRHITIYIIISRLGRQVFQCVCPDFQLPASKI